MLPKRLTGFIVFPEKITQAHEQQAWRTNPDSFAY
jgi:hypothetical protein